MAEAHDDHDHFDAVDAGASLTVPKQCSAFRKGECVVIKGRPCKIVEMSTSKTGKHGHAKVSYTITVFLSFIYAVFFFRFTSSPSIFSLIRNTRTSALPLTIWRVLM